MANSRNSTPLSNASHSPEAVFQRALEDILARVVVSGRIAMAYSGGLDSSVLLHLAADACRQRGLQLFAFHVHHGLSPNADHWLAHCEAQARRTGTDFAARRVQISLHPATGIEQAARQARYDALAGLCRSHEITLLLTAHHQDDQTETVLLQWLRGAGLPGLSAMPVLQTNHALLGEGIALGRPLLNITRAELEAYASCRDISFVTDESNADTRFRRNALRHQLIPVLEQNLPGASHAIARSARHLQAAQTLLDELAAADLQRCCAGHDLLIDTLQPLSEARLDNLLRYWLRQRGADQYPAEAQLAQLREQMLFAREGAQPLLTLAGLLLERRQGRLTASRARPRPAAAPGEIFVQWRGEPEIAVPAWQGSLVFEPVDGPGLDPEPLLNGPLRLCPRSGGERLKLDPGRPSRTLKNLFQEAAVPARMRRWLPLLYLGDQLVFAAGLGTDVRARHASEGIRLRWHAGD